MDGAVRPSQRPATSPCGLTTQQPPLRDQGHHSGTPRTARSGRSRALNSSLDRERHHPITTNPIGGSRLSDGDSSGR